jgi:hypothetical protein
MGRPSSYTLEIAREICERLESGEPLAAICRDEDMPAARTVYDWREADLDGFSAAFARARAIGFDAIADQCLAIADTQEEGEIITKDNTGTTVKREDMLGHRKLRVDTRLKLLAKWDPKRYGEQLRLQGDPEAPLSLPADPVATIAAMLAAAQQRREQHDAGDLA